MFPYYDSHQAAGNHDKAMAVLKQWQVEATPIHYMLAYDTVANTNKEITTAIDGQQGKVDERFLLALFHRVYLNIDQSTVDTSESVSLLISKLLSTLATTHEGNDTYLGTLKQSAAKLGQDQSLEGLQALVGELIGTTESAVKSQAALSQQLAAAEDEMNHLKDVLASSRKAMETDQLTGLMNRQGIEKAIDEWHLAPNPCALLVCDIDWFKKINDTYGHLVGDKVLVRIAKEIKTQVKGKDLVGRWGGEEFLVILRDVNALEDAQATAETIRAAVEKVQLAIGKDRQRLPTITLSIGGVLINPDSNWTEAFDQADKHLYAAKENGRNQVRLS